MKRRFIATIMVFCLVFSLFTVTSNAASKKKKVKYVKVKSTTYQTYKRAYSQNKTLKNQIKSKDNAIKTKNTVIANKNKEIAKLKTDLDSANSMNRWVWSNINSMGIDYEKKTWTIPKEMPEKFVIDGVTYKVIREE